MVKLNENFFSVNLMEIYQNTITQPLKHATNTSQKDHAKERENYFCLQGNVGVIFECHNITIKPINVMS